MAWISSRGADGCWRMGDVAPVLQARDAGDGNGEKEIPPYQAAKKIRIPILWAKRKEMSMKTLKVRVTFQEEILGTAAADPEIHKTYIAGNAPDAPSLEEEVAALGTDAVVEKSMTVFPRENGAPILWDYQIKGFFKDATGMLARVDGTESKKIKAYKKIVDGLVFVYPRKIPLVFDGEIGNCQRPLRAQTAQGVRVALANSET